MEIETNKVKKEHYLIRQDNIKKIDKIFFFNYRTSHIKATESIK